MVYGTEAGHVIYSSLDGIASNPNASNETINTRTALFFNVADVGESIIHHECLGVPLLFFCVLRSAHSKRPDKCRRAAYDVGGWFPDQQFVGRAFYRVWLQTRLEELLGSWPAIMLTSIPWSIWHIKIQHTGYLPADVVMAIANQGVTGLFLGYLWSRYRNMWVLIMVHGIINAPPQLLLELWNM
ncbi:CPBP family intramembrane metalloprotease [Laceyella tengchongensis]|nr:CPBP family intramembrane metalloprotease [Laceyella tengchongensis]